MKTTILYILLVTSILLTLGVACLLLRKVTPDIQDTLSVKRTRVHISIRKDITEVLLAQPDTAEILPLFGLDEDQNNGAEFDFGYASDVSLNRITAFSLAPAGSQFATNRFERAREVKAFTSSVSDFLAAQSPDTVGRDHSSIYAALAESANRLGRDSADVRILIMYSDLRENTAALSFYDPATLALLRTDPAQVSVKLEAQVPLEDLHGVQVYLIYVPNDQADDATFTTVSHFYKTLLESHGATVIISANVQGL